MGMKFIVLGDPTSHGGAVVSAAGAGRMVIGGIPVACIGDAVSCPIPGHSGAVIVQGASGPVTMLDGRPIARMGDMTSCGASLISAGQAIATHAPGGGGGGAAAAGPGASGSFAMEAGDTPPAGGASNANPTGGSGPTAAEGRELASSAQSAGGGGAATPTVAKSGGGAAATPAAATSVPTVKVEEELTFVEFRLLNTELQPIPNETFNLTLPDGKVVNGKLDSNGFVRVDDVPRGKCQIRFPNLI